MRPIERHEAAWFSSIHLIIDAQDELQRRRDAAETRERIGPSAGEQPPPSFFRLSIPRLGIAPTDNADKSEGPLTRASSSPKRWGHYPRLEDR